MNLSNTNSISIPTPIFTLPPSLCINGTITVRRWHPTDAPSLAAAADNRKIWANLRDRMPNPYTLADAECWVNECGNEEKWSKVLIFDAEGNESEEGRVCTEYGLFLDSTAIGSIGLVIGTDVARRTAELGYWLGEPYWGKGVMGAVVPEFMRWVWSTFPGMVRVHSDVYERNLGSAGVLKRSGFAGEGRLRKGYFKEGVVGDLLIFAAVRE